MAIVWALLTVSSEPQVGTLAHQRAWAEGIARDRGWSLTRVIEGVASGKEGPRTICRDLLLEVRATPVEARPEHVLMIRLDRVGRGSIIDSQIFVRDLRALGARLFTRDSGEIRLDSAMDELIAAVQMAVARHENDVRSEKLRALYRRRRAAGEVLSNRVAYGIELTPERQLRAQKSHVKTIRRVFEMRLEGVGVSAIARWLVEHAPPHVFTTGKSYPVCWSDSRVARLIQNRCYIGTVVAEETWLKAQRVANYMGRAPRGTRKHGEFPLASALRCVCGRGISAETSNGRRNRERGVEPNRYYVCKAGWNHGGSWPHHRAVDVETAFVEFLGSVSRAPSSFVKRRALAEATATIGTLDRRLERLRKKHDAVEVRRARVWRLDDAGHLEPADIATRLDVLNTEKELVEAAIVRVVEERCCLPVFGEFHHFISKRPNFTISRFRPSGWRVRG